MRLCACLPFLLLIAFAGAQVPLAELPGLARARADRLRPAQEEAMKPFWRDLSLEYRSNAPFLEQRLAIVATLGDSVVPALLEKLQPADGGPAARNLAGNCRRVLERLDPATFLDALIELCNGPSDVARSEAMRLLGCARGARAVQALTDLLARVRDEDRLLVLEAVVQQAAPEAAAKVLPLLGSDDRRVREAVLSYLQKAKPQNAVDTVVQALTVEKDLRLLPQYVDFLANTAHDHDGAAKALLPLLDQQRLDWVDVKRLVQALATVAPHEHVPTCQRLLALIDEGDAGQLALQAGLTLKALGEKTGLQKLRKQLNDLLASQRRKKDPLLYELRANLYFAQELMTEALLDYAKVVEFSSSTLLTRRAQTMMARAEAHRHKWSMVLQHLKEVVPTTEELQELAREDSALAEALQQDAIRAYVATLQSGRSSGTGK